MMRIVAFAVCVSLCQCQPRLFYQWEAKIQRFLGYQIIVRANVTRHGMHSYHINTTQVYKPKNANFKVYVYTPHSYTSWKPKVKLEVGREYLLGGNAATYYSFPSERIIDDGEITCDPCYYEPWSPRINEFLTHYLK